MSQAPSVHFMGNFFRCQTSTNIFSCQSGHDCSFLLGGARTQFLEDILPYSMCLTFFPSKKKKSRQHFFFVNSYQYNLRNEWLRSKEKIETEPFVTVCTSKYSGLDNVWAGEYISLYPLVTHSAMKCSNTIWMDTLWRVDCKKPCPYWHNIEDKLLGSTSRISYTHMSTVMEFAINIFGFLPT